MKSGSIGTCYPLLWVYPGNGGAAFRLKINKIAVKNVRLVINQCIIKLQKTQFLWLIAESLWIVFWLYWGLLTNKPTIVFFNYSRSKVFFGLFFLFNIINLRATRSISFKKYTSLKEVETNPRQYWYTDDDMKSDIDNRAVGLQTHRF